MATSRPLIGKDLRFFAKTQSAFQTIAADYPAATDAIEPKSDGGLVVTPAQSFTLIGDEATGLAFARRVIEQAHGVSWSSSILAYLSGTAGTAPDWEPLLLLVASLQDSGAGRPRRTGPGRTRATSPLSALRRPRVSRSAGGCRSRRAGSSACATSRAFRALTSRSLPGS